MAADRKRHRRFGKKPRLDRASRPKLHCWVFVQGHLQGPEEGNTASKPRQGLGKHIKTLIWTRVMVHVGVRANDGRRSASPKDPAHLFSHGRRQRTGTGLVAGVAARRAPSHRQGSAPSAMAVAGGHATMSPAARRTLGNPDGLAYERTARVLLCFYRGHLVALHAFIKKTRTTPVEDLALARKRHQGLER